MKQIALFSLIIGIGFLASGCKPISHSSSGTDSEKTADTGKMCRISVYNLNGILITNWTAPYIESFTGPINPHFVEGHVQFKDVNKCEHIIYGEMTLVMVDEILLPEK